jgi:hypothetical protein
MFEQQDQQKQVVETNRSIKSLIGSQFSTQVRFFLPLLHSLRGFQQSPSSNPGGVSHDKILEKYIQEKVGTIDSKYVV